MSVRSKDEILGTLKEIFEGVDSDLAISTIEDISDTMDDYNNRLNDSTNWQEKYEQNDAEWRQRYKDRFFNSGSEDEQEDEYLKPKGREFEKPKTFEELFKEG